MVINTASSVDELSCSLLKSAISAMEPHVILVVAHERLYSDLTQEFVGLGTEIVKLPKSGGVRK